MMEKNSDYFTPPSAPYLTPQSSIPDKQLENNVEGTKNIVPQLLKNNPEKDVAAEELVFYFFTQLESARRGRGGVISVRKSMLLFMVSISGGGGTKVCPLPKMAPRILAVI